MTDITRYIEGKKHVIWDWNGTLLNDLDSVLHALQKLATKLGVKPVDRDTYLAKFRFPVSEFYKDIGFFRSEEQFKEISSAFHFHYAEAIHLADLYTGTKEILEQVRAQGSTQSILTAAFQKHIDYWLKDFSIDHLFDFVYGQKDMLATSKLERGRELIELSNIPPEETVLFGDTTHDFEVGHALGIDVVLLTDGHQHVDRLKQVHHVVFQRK